MFFPLQAIRFMSYLVPGLCFSHYVLSVSFSSSTDRVESLAYGFLVLMALLDLI